MVGRRRAGAHAAPRHARPSAVRGIRAIALLVVGGVMALSAAVLLSSSPAGAEASRTTATLTLTGVRDSSCDFATGGTDVYVKPGGTVTFKGELAGIKVTVPVLGAIELSSSAISSFDYKLVVNGDTKHPHYVNNTKSFVYRNVSGGTHRIAWSANAIYVNVPILGSIKVALNGDTVLPSSLPVGGQLNWTGAVKATNNTKCGVSIQVPGGGVTVGPIHLSVPPIHLPTLSVPNLPGLPGGGGSSSSSSHHPGGGGHSTSPGGGGGSTSVSGLPTPIPELVVPNAGSGGDSAFGGGGGVQALPDGGGIGPFAPAGVTSTAGSPAHAPSTSPKRVNLATDSTDGGLGGAQLPVLLAIIAIIALSLVTATYARMYLLRRP